MSKINVDMSHVDDSSIPAGDYICIVKAIEVKQGDKGQYLKWELQIGTGEQKGKKLFTNTSLAPKALFRLRDMLSALGISVPKSTIQIDTDKYIKRILGVTVKLKDYEGRKVADVKGLWKPEKDGDGRYRKPKDESEESEPEVESVESSDESEDNVEEIDV